MIRKKVLFIGAGGYAKSVLDSLDKDKFELIGFIDNFQNIGNHHLGYPIIANNIETLPNRQDYEYFISIGDNTHRVRHFINLMKFGCKLINVIDKTALISDGSTLGIGVFVGKYAIINNGTSIGNNVIINTKSLVEHGCIVEDHCNISTNATLNGDVIVESASFVGSSSVINGQLRVGTHSIVGSGAVVVKNVTPYTIVAGVPAKHIRNIK